MAQIGRLKVLPLKRSLVEGFLTVLVVGPASSQEPARVSPAQSYVSYVNVLYGMKYVGEKPCVRCHEDKFKSYKRTGMGRSMAIPSASDGLGEFAHRVELHSKETGRSYSVFTHAGKVFEKEYQLNAEGKEIFSDAHELAYAVGSGEHGRSYLIAQGSFLFMAPLSFYSTSHKWDFSPGHEGGPYLDFDRPAGERCMNCHAGLPRFVVGTRNQYERPPFRFLSIGCERCHGPGELHVQQRSQGQALEGPIDRSIVNPAKLAIGLRDDVCAQCHLGGDAQVLRPGKSYEDFRPGTALDDVVAIFSVAASLKARVFKPLGHLEQMRLSRCWVATKGALGCITCHDPHAEPRGLGAVSYFKNKCLSCHRVASCKGDLKAREAASPPDNCLQCHMPKRSVSTISHTALTDHLIPRIPGQPPRETPSQAGSRSDSDRLVHETLAPGLQDDSTDLRTLALAYAQVAAVFPAYRKVCFTLLEQAAREFPDDADVESMFGIVLLQGSRSPDSKQLATQAFARALELNSKSAVVRTQLAELKASDGDLGSAIRLLQEAIHLEPYYPPAYLDLARILRLMNNRTKAVAVLEQVLKFQPGNEIARKELEKARASAASR